MPPSPTDHPEPVEGGEPRSQELMRAQPFYPSLGFFSKPFFSIVSLKLRSPIGLAPAPSVQAQYSQCSSHAHAGVVVAYLADRRQKTATSSLASLLARVAALTLWGTIRPSAHHSSSPSISRVRIPLASCFRYFPSKAETNYCNALHFDPGDNRNWGFASRVKRRRGAAEVARRDRWRKDYRQGT